MNLTDEELQEKILKVLWAREPGERIPMTTIDRQVYGIMALFHAHDLTIEKKLLEALPDKWTVGLDNLDIVAWYNEGVDRSVAAIKSVFRGESE